MYTHSYTFTYLLRIGGENENANYVPKASLDTIKMVWNFYF